MSADKARLPVEKRRCTPWSLDDCTDCACSSASLRAAGGCPRRVVEPEPVDPEPQDDEGPDLVAEGQFWSAVVFGLCLLAGFVTMVVKGCAS